MNKLNICYQPIGIIHSQHHLQHKTPVQPVFAADCQGWVEVFPEYLEGLCDIEGFSHIYLIYHLHKIADTRLTVRPFLQNKEHGIFATRAPWRPNPIGLSVLRLCHRKNNRLYLQGLDILDGTPLLDIKPCTTRFDWTEIVKNGWFDEVDDETAIRRGRREFNGGTRQ
ncbi:tRNA (N6-threonylcarbamoyladenosine(37)-N6)-methyltransferase TrmO [Escherichia albertii]|uniref:tRNA (N6-threonylcarbamoyladenosine(37)-N6)-methyltransferase TrmO n=1 Tax=Escherichia albertii TaxID=208962 RepID=A0ABX5HBD3_ESCAL|nr:tRNA (N6-threonylcarbamoyladenosine(37)-N6)-methyltransferase TrmO [Escherichia albertii]EJM1769829.1 tRNA (N6-threonylcarbamoyladenosine(37)-N6)-methyltransferase TrmO [Escherichia albertii]EJO0120035.1 tRNA (N6-threonylcarbamoyladenosine(37)-N6)-methyltransferase TrmO [Escherichia albertii]MCU7273728.1 tRNA (N6-threonylcarbamoyladenosine(37)-N6)-methyltransferase TrmO [Escherichia albertii]PSY37471.1 tRNA (N6-threonylcarbamoyladenosine(37)-N6)-methyltransferase TrmO [Escherichia albertii]